MNEMCRMFKLHTLLKKSAVLLNEESTKLRKDFLE